MYISPIPQTLFRPQPPPLWYVTNGELTVGPVVTGLLMRGVEYGRVPEYCHVRPYRGSWRALDAVREISALYRRRGSAKTAGAEQLAEWGRSVERIKDETELCHTVTWLALAATAAESAMFHYRGRSSPSLVTRSVLGPMSRERLGYALREDDLLLRAARLGRPVTGPPYGLTEDALAMRFASSQGGAGAVAMIPIFVGTTLKAMLEVSRPGHAFRRSDLQAAERIVQRACAAAARAGGERERAA
jgi:hypothetical protein